MEYGSGATGYFDAALRPGSVQHWQQFEINPKAVAENRKRNIYNFVNPNLGLKGRMPAEISDMDLKLGQNKLLGLIIYSAKRIDVSKR